MHQHALPAAQPRQHRQPVQRGEEYHRHAGGRDQRQPVGHRCHQSLVDHRLGADDPQQPHDRITDGQPGHVGGDLDDHTGALGPQLAAAGIHPQRHQHIAEVDPDRGHRHPHLPRDQFGSRARAYDEVLQGALAAGVQPPATGRQADRGVRPHRPQPGRIGDAPADHHLRLTATDYRVGIQRPVGVDQHHAAGVLGLRRAHQAPHRGAGKVRNVFAGKRDRAAGPHGQHPVAVGAQPRLQHLQGLGGRRVHRLHHVAAVICQLPHRGLCAVVLAAQRDR